MDQRDQKARNNGSVLSQNGAPQENRSEKAREYLKKVVEMCSDNIEALIELAHLQEQTDPQVFLSKLWHKFLYNFFRLL